MGASPAGVVCGTRRGEQICHPALASLCRARSCRVFIGVSQGRQAGAPLVRSKADLVLRQGVVRFARLASLQLVEGEASRGAKQSVWWATGLGGFASRSCSLLDQECSKYWRRGCGGFAPAGSRAGALPARRGDNEQIGHPTPCRPLPSRCCQLVVCGSRGGKQRRCLGQKKQRKHLTAGAW